MFWRFWDCFGAFGIALEFLGLYRACFLVAFGLCCAALWCECVWIVVECFGSALDCIGLALGVFGIVEVL